jgi:hypothetical protein
LGAGLGRLGVVHLQLRHCEVDLGRGKNGAERGRGAISLRCGERVPAPVLQPGQGHPELGVLGPLGDGGFSELHGLSHIARLEARQSRFDRLVGDRAAVPGLGLFPAARRWCARPDSSTDGVQEG